MNDDRRDGKNQLVASAPLPPAGARSARPSGRVKAKIWLFRFLAVLLGLVPLLVSEVTLRLAGAGLPQDEVDPYVGFSDIQPLFVLNESTGRCEIPVSRQVFFRPESFPAEKSRRGYRIFCFGGSTVQGRPYAIETSFTTWLELTLKAGDPNRDWDVVNCGGVSYASYRLVPILQEALGYQPDLFIIYTGHNEFLEDRSYGKAKHVSPLITRAQRWMSHLRTYCVLRTAWVQWSANQAAGGGRTVLPADVDALLDYRGGLEEYHRDDPWREGTIEHLEFNLRRMVHIARKAGVPVLLVDPVCNLKDCPPFKVEQSAELTGAQRTEFDRLWDQARSAEIDSARRAELLERAVEIDPRHAGALFHLGKCYEEQEAFEKAKACYVRAKDEDICPLRIVEPMRRVIRQVAREFKAPLVDIQGRFELLSPGGLTGNELLVDHVHPSIRGHQLIAEMFMESMIDQHVITPRADWKQRRKALYNEHLDTLDVTYYARGKERLEGLRRWTEGRAFRVRSQPGTRPKR